MIWIEVAAGDLEILIVTSRSISGILEIEGVGVMVTAGLPGLQTPAEVGWGQSARAPG